MKLKLFCIIFMCAMSNERIFVFAHTKDADVEAVDESSYKSVQSEESRDLLKPVVRYDNICGGTLAHDKSPIEISIKLKNESKQCAWTIEAPEGRRIEFFYYTVGCLSTVSDCSKVKPYVCIIYDGSNENTSDIVYDSRSYGSRLEPFISSGNEATVDLYYREDIRSDRNISYELAFRFRYV